MHLTILSLALLLAASIDGFFGIPFGTSQAETRAALDSASGATLRHDTIVSGIGMLEYRGGSLAGNEVKSWTVMFVDDRLGVAAVELKADTDIEREAVIALYRSVVQDLREKYGKPTEAYLETQLPGYRKSWSDHDILWHSLTGGSTNYSGSGLKHPLYHTWTTKVKGGTRSLDCRLKISSVVLRYSDDVALKKIEQGLINSKPKKRDRRDDY